MKMNEMADLLDGLAGALERVMQKGGLNDLREVSACFRRFPDDTVASFCKYVGDVREGKTSRSRAAKPPNEEVINGMVAKVLAYRDNHKSYDYPTIRQLAAEVGKLTLPNFKAVTSQVGCPLSGTKQQMVLRFENWLMNLKQSADRASFSLPGAVAS
jgi:hypothetical protein